MKKGPMKKKKDRMGIWLVLVFLIGLSILLYPSLSDAWNMRVQTKAMVDYQGLLERLQPEDYSAYLKKAESYNRKLGELRFPLSEYASVPGYESMLKIEGSDIMGTLSIERLHLTLPIYHGTSDAVLNVSVGHLQGSSLPIGGEGTHAVLSAHRGLPSARLFSDLDDLSEGDRFVICVLDREITYEVDQIRIVLPEETGELEIEEGQDYCTLLTCTPYGINTHRLLVRGVRVENEKMISIVPDAYLLDSLLIAPIVAAPMLLFLLLWMLIKYRKKKAFPEGEER